MNRRNLIIAVTSAAVISIILVYAIGKSRSGSIIQGPVISDRQTRDLYKRAERFKVRKNYTDAIINYEKVIELSEDPKLIPTVLYELADAYEQNEQLLGAKSCLRRIVMEYPDSDLLQAAQEKLGNINVALLFSPAETEDSVFYMVKPGDTLEKIAKNFNTSVWLIKESNNLESDLIRPDMRLKISKANFSIFVDKSVNKLTLNLNDDFFKSYTVSTGNNDLTPAGEYTIVNKLVDPVWYYEGKVISPESEENILGTRWLGLSLPKYGIHGTNDPATIGKYVTKGCIRMLNQDVEELYKIVPVGTKVIIVE